MHERDKTKASPAIQFSGFLITFASLFLCVLTKISQKVTFVNEVVLSSKFLSFRPLHYPIEFDEIAIKLPQLWNMI